MADDTLNALTDMIAQQRKTFDDFTQEFQKNRSRLQTLWDDGMAKTRFVPDPKLAELEQLLTANPQLIDKVTSYAKNLVARIQAAVQAELSKEATS